jgi:hypothetical protein
MEIESGNEPSLPGVALRAAVAAWTIDRSSANLDASHAAVTRPFCQRICHPLCAKAAESPDDIERLFRNLEAHEQRTRALSGLPLPIGGADPQSYAPRKS